MSSWTGQELMAVTAARLLEDNRIIFAGVGMPILAALLARSRPAPRLTIALAGGIIGPSLAPGRLPISTNEMRAARRAGFLTDITDVFLCAQRGFFHYGLLGAAQVDPFGNINSSVIGDPGLPKVRLPGSGGANDIASLCTEVLILIPHEPRRFVDSVDFVTSPGNLSGGDSRRRAGLLFGGPTRVATDLAVFDFQGESGRMRLVALQPGVTESQVRTDTPITFHTAETVALLEPPSEDELATLRELDSGGVVLG